MLSPLDTASVLISTTDAPHLEATELTSDLDAFEEAFPVTWLMVTPDEDWFAKYPPVKPNTLEHKTTKTINKSVRFVCLFCRF